MKTDSRLLPQTALSNLSLCQLELKIKLGSIVMEKDGCRFKVDAEK